ncbi:MULTISPECIES: ribosomal protein S18-alanine N-acetyltransferase [unclassified Modicisalibacter]|uniref:ribosomal protein S18-alanine N-acetyltransferase n=1 Tax=unclassified Modicisalibacter TaxID=2679913 RepID=UPI001CCC73F6|nr:MULTISPECIES: ribosomal protein S18-alanine N-acetyltransferase [unclassified Modicisalibacter]MBZ9558183.1 ribosomal protein S18-alanine N-acetyltransferase [Modicisalibacter sp. R2A 31.J]MBZ9573148.1 ribosomal protein S18-alanine N-acetyltransferase [Modicisalibacter sp. MOD 31.J]
MSDALRRLTPDDLAALVALESAGQPHPWREATLAAALADPGYELWGVVDDTQTLIGYAALSRLPFDAELQAITVAPAARRRGIASRLLERVLARAAGWGSERLLLEVRESNLAARSLYAALGFGVDGRRRGYYPLPDGGSEAAVLMSRALSPTAG